jgi:hypothetical protein
MWDLPAPHTITVNVTAADIDAYDHVNNSVYTLQLSSPSSFERPQWMSAIASQTSRSRRASSVSS